MAEEVGMLTSAYEQLSSTLTSIGTKTKAFDKSMQELEQTCAAYEKTQAAATKQIAALRSKLVESDTKVEQAKKNWSKYKDEMSKSALDKAIREQTEYQTKLADTQTALQRSRSAMMGYANEVRKASNQGGLIKDLSKSRAFRMLGESLSGAANAYLESALGESEGRLVSGTLSGALSGAAMGAMTGNPLVIAAGALVGGISGTISGGTEVLQARDDAFKSYYGELYSSAGERHAAELESGSGIASGRETDLISFSTLFGSRETAKTYLSELVNMANTTPFFYDDLTAMSKTLATFGYDAESILPVLSTIGDAGAALGMSTSDMTTVAQALGQMKSSDKATLEYLNILNDRGIGAVGILAEAKGKSRGEIYNMISKGQIAGTEAVEIILSALTDGFSGAMEEQSKTFAGRSSTLEGWEQEMANAQGEAYNTLRSEGKQRQIDYYSGIADEMSGLNAMIGAGEAAQENLKEQYLREAMTTLLTGTGGSLYEGEQAETLARLHEEYTALEAAFQDASEEEKITLGEKADSLKSQAEALAEGAFGASDKMQEVRDVELELIAAIRDNTKALGEAAYLADYEKQQELSKGRGLNGNVTADSSYRSLRERDYGTHAWGLGYVPYDNFPALLHQGERVLTASQARAADQGAGPRVQVTVTGNSFYGSDKDLEDRVARRVASEVVRAVELGV
ncbi:tape measure protein [Intestinimonas butyriciproducens]|uniref:tape measure protein n=1 Tax=Intestinimonas butyriciproducens TaxID=1297617 RepID=UPI00242C5779|nr:tape measure protein [Intestinimonas butyriciproducens]MCI6362784.1 tape measure protein [Intestinimonas butyriciproducens]MDY3616788.1 tape measure protein [Intestinimonas butyriciproducens]